MDELSAVKKIMIGLFILIIGALALSYFKVQGNGSSFNSAQFSGFQRSMNNTIVLLQSTPNVTVIQINPNTNSATGIFGSVQNAIVWFGNGVFTAVNLLWKFVFGFIQIIVLLFTGLLFMLYILFVFMPSILLSANLGDLGLLFTTGYGLIIALTVIFMFKTIRNMTGEVIGAVRSVL